MYDAIVIGGGFYGTTIAAYLAQRRGFSRIALIESEESLFSHASHNNQARVHNGYHYPRSFITGFRSRANLPRFLTDYPDCIEQELTMLYAIARKNSKVTAKQFQRFCNETGAVLQPAPISLKKLFISHLIEEIFLVTEHVFDARKLCRQIQQELERHQVEILLKTTATGIHHLEDKQALQVTCTNHSSGHTPLTAKFIFNCTYSGLNQFSGDFTETKAPLKHEMTEMLLIDMPPALKHIGITVMDGPFFSIMPFPPAGLHTLSHVRYTPHYSWSDRAQVNPYQELNNYARNTRADRMIRDVARYFPSIMEAQYVKSLFEVKTILQKNENDDGRPILFEKHSTLPGCYSILGGKVDNIYDVLEKLDAEPL